MKAKAIERLAAWLSVGMRPRTIVTLGALWALAAWPADLRLGIIGTDTSHVTAFTRLLNDESSPQHIAGARVVAAFKGGSKELPDSYNRVDKFAEELKTRWNVEFAPDIPTLCQKVDGVMIESVDGRQHLEQVKQALASGKPLWIDKPLAASLEDAREIARLAKQAGVPWFSASSLRYGKDVELSCRRSQTRFMGHLPCSIDYLSSASTMRGTG